MVNGINNEEQPRVDNAWSDAAREAAAEARKHSEKAARASGRNVGGGKRVPVPGRGPGSTRETLRPEASGEAEVASAHAMVAEHHASSGNREKAAASHKDAADSHDKAAEIEAKSGRGVQANLHKQAAARHREAAKGTYNAAQPRHPKHQTFQGHARVAARKGYLDTAEPDTSGLPVDDEDEEVGHGDRPPERRSTSNSFTVNPFASEPQRRYLWSQEPEIAKAWAHGEHTSDKDHKMPERTGKDVKGPLAKVERAAQLKSTSTASERKRKSTRNCSMGNNGMYDNSSDPHAASSQAAMMSMQRDDAARGHALAAHDASKDGDSAGASRSHIGAAKEHEKMALKARKGKDPETADANDRAAAMHRKAASMHAAVTNGRVEEYFDRNRVDNRRQETGSMTLTRDELLEPLVANCACDSDAAVLNSLSDETLAALHRGQRRRITRNTKADSSNADVIGGGEKQAGGEDDDDDANDPDGTDDLKVRGKGRFAGNAKDDDDDEDDDGIRNAKDNDQFVDEDDDEIKPPPIRSGAGRGDTVSLPARNARDHGTRNQPMTMKEMLANASQEDQAVWNHAVEIEKRERTALVRRLVANVADKAQRHRLANNLMRKPLGELRDMIALVPAPVSNRMVPRREPVQDYTGAAGGFDGPTVNRGGDKEEVLDILTINELDAEEKVAKKAQ